VHSTLRLHCACFMLLITPGIKSGLMGAEGTMYKLFGSSCDVSRVMFIAQLQLFLILEYLC